MAFGKGNLLNHFLILREAAGFVGAEAFLNISNFRVYLRHGDRHVVLHPQFLVDGGGMRRYVHVPSLAARAFIGWLPYHSKRWDLATDKLAFKETMANRGIMVPAHAIVDVDIPDGFLVKRRLSSFSKHIDGPFRHGEARVLDAKAGEYAEAFIRGRILKIWYWNAHPVCMEIMTPPTVRGDGCSSVRSLIERRLRDMKRTAIGRPGDPSASPFDFSDVVQMLAFDGKTLDTVLESGTEQIVDFRYVTPLALPASRRVVDLQGAMPAELAPQLQRIGACAWQGIPAALREDTVYTIDAILDANSDIHVLEMNSNPYLHPLVYRMLVPALFPSADSPRETLPH